MTNREHYKERILDMACQGKLFGLNKITQMICPCACMECRNCAFNQEGTPCNKIMQNWCDEEYIKHRPFFKEDDLVEVSNNKQVWQLGYFSHISEDGQFCVFTNGKTSKEINEHDFTIPWQYCRKYGTLGGFINED